MIAYYWCQPDDDELSWKDRLALLPNPIQKYIKGKRRPNRQRQSTYGYSLLQRGLQESFDYTLDALEILPSGKPLLQASSIQFSISHSGRLIGVALSDQGRIGLDIQAHRAIASDAASTAFFSEAEQQAIVQASNPNTCILQYWSKKEALIKAMGSTMFNQATQTDVRGISTYQNGTIFNWLALPHPYQGAIWIASEWSFDNFFAKKWTFN